MVIYCDREDSITSDFCPDFDGEWYHLQDEIDTFDKNIKWNGMWDVDEAKHRLNNNWILVVFRPTDGIKGWVWLDENKKELSNLWVNPIYRNKGIAVELMNSIHRHCQKWERWWSQIEDWNIASQKVVLKCGYKILL